MTNLLEENQTFSCASERQSEDSEHCLGPLLVYRRQQKSTVAAQSFEIIWQGSLMDFFTLSESERLLLLVWIAKFC